MKPWGEWKEEKDPINYKKKKNLLFLTEEENKFKK
jgi:hypothetical protein